MVPTTSITASAFTAAEAPVAPAAAVAVDAAVAAVPTAEPVAVVATVPAVDAVVAVAVVPAVVAVATWPVVAAGLAGRCQIQGSYAIGVAKPMSLWVDCFGTEHFPESAIAKAVEKVFDFRPAAIIDTLDLRRPIFSRTAAYGHFGENVLDMTWERTDRTEALRALV